MATDNSTDSTFDNTPIFNLANLRESIGNYPMAEDGPVTDLSEITDGPVYFATDADMQHLPKTLRYLEPVTQRFGGVAIVPPESWTPPVNTSATAKSLKVSHQYLPYPPHAEAPLPEHSKFKSKRDTKRLWKDSNQDESGLVHKDITLTQTTVDYDDFKKTEEENAKKIKEVYGLSDITDTRNSAQIKVYEGAFWHAKKFGVGNRKMTVYYGNDQVKEDMAQTARKTAKQKVAQAIASITGAQDRDGVDVEDEILDGEDKWWPGNINKAGIMNDIGDSIPGITESMFYIGGLFTFFGLHREDEDLNSLSYLHEGDPKVWYLIQPSKSLDVEAYAAKYVFDKMYVMQYQQGARQTILRKATIFNPVDLQEKVTQMQKESKRFGPFKVYRFIQFENMMVYTARRAYHYGFNAGYNVAETVNYGDRTWFESSREYARMSLYQKLDISVNLPWEYMLLQEVEKAIREFSGKETMDIVDVEGVKVMENLLSSVIYRAKAAKKQLGNVKQKTLYTPGSADSAHPFITFHATEHRKLAEETYVNDYHCAHCGHNPYLFVQICVDDFSSSNCFCLRHFNLKKGAVCADELHRIGIIERFPIAHLEGLVKKMCDITAGKTVPNMRERSMDMLEGRFLNLPGRANRVPERVGDKRKQGEDAQERGGGAGVRHEDVERDGDTQETGHNGARGGTGPLKKLKRLFKTRDQSGR